ncbi:MAG: hypothetical protein GX162_05465 [Firmicutes bacterium]|jgi:uncharacterized protein YdeI (YjbR/CyaY-like superfamily)|nr:hypothetical protein [Bacillota bacterium]
MNDDAATYRYESRADFRNWLEKNHGSSAGVWLVFTKGSKSFTVTDALEEAICFGWIDGLMKSIDEHTYRKYFSRRKNKNKWSEKNKEIFRRMQERGLMTPAGVEAYQPQEGTDTADRPEDKNAANIATLKAVLADDADILRLFEEKPPSRQKQLAGFYCDAKREETRRKRQAKIIEALKSGYDGMLY